MRPRAAALVAPLLLLAAAPRLRAADDADTRRHEVVVSGHTCCGRLELALTAIRGIAGVLAVTVTEQADTEVTLSVQTRVDVELTVERIQTALAGIEGLKATEVTSD